MKLSIYLKLTLNSIIIIDVIFFFYLYISPIALAIIDNEEVIKELNETVKDHPYSDPNVDDHHLNLVLLVVL